jgi:hypothetical protein
MKEDKEQRIVSITGQVDIFENMPGTDADAISILSQDGNEYIVSAKKMVKKLMPFAGEEVDLLFQGTVAKDHSGLEVLSVHSFKILSEEAQELINAKAKDAAAARAKRKKRNYEDEDEDENEDEELEGIDQIVDIHWHDIHVDDDEFEDDELEDEELEDEEFDAGDELAEQDS